MLAEKRMSLSNILELCEHCDNGDEQGLRAILALAVRASYLRSCDNGSRLDRAFCCGLTPWPCP